jgi:hypothetical protein
MRKLGFIVASALVLISGAAPAQVNPGASPLSIAKGGTAAATAAAARTSLGLAIGVNVQAFDAELQAIAGLTAAADKCFYFTGVGTAATYDCTSFSRGAMAQSNAANWRTSLGVIIGTDVQAFDADLSCLAGLSSTGVIKRTGAGTCSAGTVALADLATGTQDTVIGYFGSTTASATAVPNCTGALTYSTGTHTFGCNASAGTGTVTSVTLGAGYGISVSGTNPITTSGTFTPAVSLTTASNVLGADVALNNTANYFTGPSMAQGSTGTWFASGTVTLNDTNAGASNFYCKLWDGSTVISSTNVAHTATANLRVSIALSGTLASPAGNIRISCRNLDSTAAVIEFNRTGEAKDSSIYGFRIQ